VLGLFKQALHGCTRQYIPLNEETIVVAKTFTTSDLLYFPLEKVKAFVCMQGAKTSHFSEVTAKLNIPFFINKKMMISNN
jgi:phosphoenolpyruvate-protein kinase (PTS system EI component)